MNRLTRDGTAKPVSRTKFSGVNGDKEIFPWSADHVNRIGNLPVDLYSAICDNNNNNCCSVYPQLRSGISFPRRLWLGGCATHVTQCSVPGYSYFAMCVVFSSHSFWTSSSLDVPAGVTQEEGHTGFLIHLLSAVRALTFLARRIHPTFPFPRRP